jgi:hypothetical protein
MLWIGGQITAGHHCTPNHYTESGMLSYPCLYHQQNAKRNIGDKSGDREEQEFYQEQYGAERCVLVRCGFFIICSDFQNHHPPAAYMGVLLGAWVMWVITELIHSKKDEEEKGSVISESCSS